ncbi:helix-turn-helix domain-containing protein [Flavobacterium sp. J27]|uniref:helix-turn-helix domain-containing protein n=1 Tax=Flavobacterium sp. J27 TaxID=2060419 RepID=UPI001031D1BC|nr:helix-turn-helix domain-containing protein [Flavobacterium sp. J27]
MSKIKKIREELNITQEELSEKSGVSVRTIQRIEAGTEPKGYTLKSLSKALGIEEKELLEKEEETFETNLELIKLINFSALPFAIIPPLNIVVPLAIMFIKKGFNSITKQLITIQILWSIVSAFIFMLASFLKNWFALGSKFILIVMVLLVLSNVYIIIRNTHEIDKKGKLYFQLKFSII